MGEILYKELSYKIVGLAMKVHRALKNGLPEAIYQRALCHELRKENISYETERRTQVVYDGEMIGTFRMDLIVEDAVLLELKAVDALADQHRSQTLAYLKATKLRLGLLINFGVKSLKVERIVN